MELGWRQSFMGLELTYGLVATHGALPFGIMVRAEKKGYIETARCYHISEEKEAVWALADFLCKVQATPDTVQDIVEDWMYSNSLKR